MKLHVFQEGETKAEKIVFLHGFMGCGKDFSGLMKSLSYRYHSIAFDLPGHGCSTFDDFATDGGLESVSQVGSLILEQLSAAGIREFVLYGYSMGGRIAQAMCLQSPERIRHLVLESASFGIQDEVERQERYQRDCNLLNGVTTTADFRQFLEKWHLLPLFSTLSNTVLLDDLITSKLENDVHQLAHALRLMSVGNQPWYPLELNRTGVPMTYFYGEQDRKYKLIAQNSIVAIPRILLKGFEKASHNIHFQYLPEIVSALKDSLE